MKIEIIKNIEGLKSFEKSWNQGIEASNFDSLFATYEWFYSWGKNFGSDKKLFIVVAHNEANLLGVMPLLLVTRLWAGLNITTLKSMTNLESPRFNLIFRDLTVLREMFSYVSNNLEWDFIELDYLPSREKFLPEIQRLSGESFYKFLVEPATESAFVKITGEWEDYLKRLPKKVKRNLHYFEERFNKEGGFQVLTLTGGDDLEKQLIEAFEIERKSWKGEAGTSILDTPGYKKFYIDLGQNMSQKNWFELNLLIFNGEKIAFDYCLKYKNQFYVLKTGYNSQYSKNSPGRILKKKVLQRLFNEKLFESYDFVGAMDNWKREWTSDSESLSKLLIFSKRPVSKFIYHYLTAKKWIKDSIRAILRSFRIRSKMTEKE